MRVSIQLDDDITSRIEELVSSKLDEAVNKVIKENLDEIILNVVKSQLKSAALVYMQSNELRHKLLEKVVPQIDALLNVEEK